MLHVLHDLILVKVISRPSKVCKTPYVADIELNDGSIVQAHCASLGCCGLCEKNCYVYASPIKSNCVQSKSKICSYKIYLASFYEEKVVNDKLIINKQLIGIDPKLAETLVENALTQNYLKTLTNIKNYKREVKLLNSRFDFAGLDEHGKYFVWKLKMFLLLIMLTYLQVIVKKWSNVETLLIYQLIIKSPIFQMDIGKRKATSLANAH